MFQCIPIASHARTMVEAKKAFLGVVNIESNIVGNKEFETAYVYQKIL